MSRLIHLDFELEAVDDYVNANEAIEGKAAKTNKMRPTRPIVLM
jgi:hypothetical protein